MVKLLDSRVEEVGLRSKPRCACAVLVLARPSMQRNAARSLFNAAI